MNKGVTFLKKDDMLDLFLLVFWKRKKWAAAFKSIKNTKLIQASQA